MLNDITTLIIATAREIAESQELELTEGFNAETKLFGEDGVFDSMALVALVISVEQAIEEKFNTAVELANDRALSQRNSPYRTVGSLAAFAAQELESKGLKA